MPVLSDPAVDDRGVAAGRLFAVCSDSASGACLVDVEAAAFFGLSDVRTEVCDREDSHPLHRPFGVTLGAVGDLGRGGACGQQCISQVVQAALDLVDGLVGASLVVLHADDPLTTPSDLAEVPGA